MPIAHSPALETPPGEPSPVMADTLVRWTPEGIFKVSKEEPVGTAVAHAIDAFLDRVADGGAATDASGSFAYADAGQGPIAAPWNPTFDGDPRATPLGSSERMATSPFAAPAGAVVSNRRPRSNVSSVSVSRSLGSSDRMLGSSRSS
jgi:hypothetical protein